MLAKLPAVGCHLSSKPAYRLNGGNNCMWKLKMTCTGYIVQHGFTEDMNRGKIATDIIIKIDFIKQL